MCKLHANMGKRCFKSHIFCALTAQPTAGDRRGTREPGFLPGPRRPFSISQRSVSVAADIELGVSCTTGRYRRHRKSEVAALRSFTAGEVASTAAVEGTSGAGTASSLVASAAVEGYLSRKRQIWADHDGSTRRDLCAGCERPLNVRGGLIVHWLSVLVFCFRFDNMLHYVWSCALTKS